TYWAERFAAAEGIELAQSYFYTDSITDLPVLERVGEPRVVNPDPRLRRLAVRRGWPVLQLGLRETRPAPLERASIGARGEERGGGSRGDATEGVDEGIRRPA